MNKKLPHPILLYLSLILSAASGLIYEITTNELFFSYYTESSSTLAIILSTFLFGIGLGSHLFYLLLPKLKEHLIAIFAYTQLTLALYAIAVFPQIPTLINSFYSYPMPIIVFSILLLPTMLLGLVFPLINHLLQAQQPKTKDVTGLVYSYDIFGSVVGAILVGLFLIPYLGNLISLKIGVSLSLLTSLLLLPIPAKFLTIFIGIFVWFYTDSHTLPDPFELATPLNAFNTSPINKDGASFYKPTPYGAVMVKNNTLSINGREQCSLNYPDNASERKIVDYALTTLIYQQDLPLQVLNLGLGCGLTSERVLSYRDTILDVVEINPGVVEAARQFSPIFNNRPFNLHIEDGLNYLRHTDKLYDAIIVDVEHPKIIHSSNLYTTEAFALAKSRLKPGGIFALWAYMIPGQENKDKNQIYHDIIYHSLRQSFVYVYNYPDVMISTDRNLPNVEPYTPKTALILNTINHKPLNQLIEWY